MKQPAFTFWPWKVLSITVPLVAFAGALFFKARSEKPLLTPLVFFSVLSAGNCYVLSLALGEMRRILWAVPAGVIIGAIGNFVSQVPIADQIHLIYLMATAVAFVHAGMQRPKEDENRRPHPWINQGIGAFIVFLGLFFLIDQLDDGIRGVFGYSFSCSLIAALMPQPGGSRLGAFISGTYCSVWAIAVMAIAVVVSMLIAAVIVFSATIDRTFPQFLMAGYTVANYFFVSKLFVYAGRIDNIRDSSGIGTPQ